MRYFIFCLAFFTLLAVFASQLTFGQDLTGNTAVIEIKGTVLDSANRKPIEIAIVSIWAHGKVIASAVTDQAGQFQLVTTEPAPKEILVSFIGYENYKSPLEGRSHTLEILLRSKDLSLTEVVISGKKTLLQTSGDKMIYNASADISNKAGSASDVLRKVPLLTVGIDGEVKMRGSSNLKVLLNGMSSGIMAKNLKEALKMIPASSITSIEVITSPSAKYEAEGAAGVINIITKKNILGTSGNLNISGGNLEQSINASLNIARDKFDYSFNLNGSRTRQRNSSILERTSIQNMQAVGTLFQQNDATQYERGGYAGAGFAYRPDSTQKLGADLSLWSGSWPVKNTLYNRYEEGATVSEYNQRSSQTGKFQYYELAMNYQKKFSKNKHELQITGLLGRSDDRSDYTTNQFSLSDAMYFTEKGPNRGKTWDSDIQVDYAYPLNNSGSSLLETGVKFTRANSNTTYQVYNNQANPGSEQLEQIASRSDEMDYSSTIYASYLSLKFETDNKWAFRPGLRFEGTRIASTFKSNSPSFNANFNNWVPSFLISKSLNDTHELKLNYTERIRRPWIWDLNPYVNASDPRNLTSGNPQLRPETTRMLEIGHSLNASSGFTLNSSMYYYSNSNAIESLTTVDAQGVSKTTPSNVASSKRLGSNINLSMELNNKWMANGGLELYRVWFNSTALDIGNKGNFYSLNINTSYTLPKNYTLQISGDYSNGFVKLQGRSSAFWSYRLSAQKEVFNKRASILLNVNNPFQKTLSQRSYATAPTFSSRTSTNFYNRSFSISFSWKLGMLDRPGSDEKEFNESEGKPMRKGIF